MVGVVEGVGVVGGVAGLWVVMIVFLQMPFCKNPSLRIKYFM